MGQGKCFTYRELTGRVTCDVSVGLCVVGSEGVGVCGCGHFYKMFFFSYFCCLSE